MPAGDGREIARLKALAMTAYEEAAMWAVKAHHGAKAASDARKETTFVQAVMKANGEVDDDVS